MSQFRENSTGGSESPAGADQQPINMIMVEGAGGRHSEADRRRVRAAAARASAQASRETRQRNREDRDQDNIADSPSSGHPPPLPQQARLSNPSQPPINANLAQSNEQYAQVQTHMVNEHMLARPSPDPALMPLVAWSRVLRRGPAIAQAMGSHFGNLAAHTTSNIESADDQAFNPGLANLDRTDVGRGLPIVLPSGFKDLRHEVPMEGTLLVLMSRTACFDFGGPNVESRLQILLCELVDSGVSDDFAQFHPIQNYLRLACVCLVIFQGQRADGREFANDRRYDDGLRLAWEEAKHLNPMALRDRATVRASLWAVFIISATFGYHLDGFARSLLAILDELRLHSWPDLQEIFVRFIYPGSLLEEPCKGLYEALHRNLAFTG